MSTGTTRITSFSSTPTSQRISSTRHEDYCPNVQVTDLAKLMEQELKDAKIEVENLDKLVFPDNQLPFIITKKLIKAVQWKIPRSRKEDAIARWLNDVTMNLAKHTKQGALRKWDSCMKNMVAAGSNIKRKPDIVVVGKSFRANKGAGKPDWREFHAYTEVTSQPISTKLEETTWQKSFVMFEAQPTRRFIPSLAFNRDHAFFYVCDRAGVVYSKTLKLVNNKCKNELLRLIAGFAFGPEHLLGYDPTMKRSGNKITTITVKEEEYTVDKRLFTSVTMRGRATQCWTVCSKDGKRYILKDSWIDIRRQLNEIAILKEISDVANVPTLIEGWDVQLPDGTMDTTNLRRPNGQSGEERIHRRLLIMEVGEPLGTFRSKKELIGAFIDVVKAHQVLCDEKKILHRDISHNNIMLYQPHQGLSSGADRRGFLSDYDYAARLVPIDEADVQLGVDSAQRQLTGTAAAQRQRTGTAPFMAVEILRADHAISQSPKHDIESFFWVLLYICMKYKGPGSKRDVDDLGQFVSFGVDLWFAHGKSFKELADMKVSQLARFDEAFIKKLDPYFHDLKECLGALKEAIFGASPYHHNAEHDPVLRVLRNAHGKLHDEPPQAPPSKGVSSSSRRDSKSDHRPLGISTHPRSVKRPGGHQTVDSGLGSSGESHTSKRQRRDHKC